MNKIYRLVSILAAVMAICCGLAGLRGFIQERAAGKEYETLLESAESPEQGTEEQTVSETSEESESSEQASESAVTSEPLVTSETAESSDFQTREDLDWEALQQRNPDIYAWIEVPGTKVDYPIVQHPTDNSYYLTRTIDHKKTTAASIYTEYYNSTDFQDHHTVIYGHNMKNGTMFRTLHNYEDYEFFEENRDIIIYMPDQTLYYEIFAAYTYDNRHLLNYYNCEESDSFQAYLDEIFAIRDFGACIDREMEVTAEDRIITLSTCVNSGASTQRYLVQAVLVSIDQ